MMKYLLGVLALLVLAGCHGSADIRGDGYRIQTDSHDSKPGNGPRHCPPGHAKKGWC